MHSRTLTALELPIPAVPAAVRRVLLLGQGELANAVNRSATERGAHVRQLRAYTDRELRRELAGADTVAVISRDDAEALRSALLVEHIRPNAPLVVTVFDRTVAEQLREVVPNCRVLSLADAVTPALVEACLGPAGPPRRRRPAWLRVALRPVDASARLLMLGLGGLCALLVLELAMSLTVLHEPLDRALYAATNVLGTVGPNAAVAHGPAWVRVVSSASSVLTLASAAAFTAGLVNRVTSRRLVTLAGPRTPPPRNHVVVVGLGQVGLRLCLELRRLGVPVLAVECVREHHHVTIARRAGIPVVIGHGQDRQLLERIGAARARALAAVTSTDTTNIEAAIASRALAPELEVVLRAGDDDLASETQFLFHIGTVVHANRVAGELLADLVASAHGPAR
jgi:Trk K+ transport system NAD-binding subunit